MVLGNLMLNYSRHYMMANGTNLIISIIPPSNSLYACTGKICAGFSFRRFMRHLAFIYTHMNTYEDYNVIPFEKKNIDVY